MKIRAGNELEDTKLDDSSSKTSFKKDVRRKLKEIKPNDNQPLAYTGNPTELYKVTKKQQQDKTPILHLKPTEMRKGDRSTYLHRLVGKATFPSTRHEYNALNILIEEQRTRKKK